MNRADADETRAGADKAYAALLGWGADAKGGALVRAADAGHGRTVKRLLEAGVDPDTLSIWPPIEEDLAVYGYATEYSDTALVCAATNGHEGIVRQLLTDTGAARVDKPNSCGYTPLMVAAQSGGEGATDILGLLLEAGADKYKQNHDGETALSLMMQRGSCESAKSLLVKVIIDADKQSEYGLPALMDAAMMTGGGVGCVDEARLLLEADADVNKPNSGGYTALMLAAQHENEEAALEPARMLLEAGADVNKPIQDGVTALMLARRCGNEDTQRLACAHTDRAVDALAQD